MLHLQSISYQLAHKRSDVYPFNIPFLYKFRKLTLEKLVNLLKITLL